MKVDKNLFIKYGVDCKRYAEFIESLVDGEGRSSHHVYPVAVFGEREEIIHITPEHHTMAHVLLAIDCDGIDMTLEVSKLVRGAKIRVGLDSDFEVPSCYKETLKRLIKEASSVTAANQWRDSEVKEKMKSSISISKREKFQNEEYRNELIPKYSKAQKDLWKDPSYRESQKAAMKAGWSDEDKRKKQSESVRAKFNTPEMKERFSKLAKERCSDEEYKKKVSESKKNPLVKKKYSYYHLWKHLVKLAEGNYPLDHLFSDKSVGKLNLLFNYFEYLLEALEIDSNIIQKYKKLYPKTEKPFSEDLVAWSRMTDSEWSLVKEYLNKTLS